jgi:SMC interacting uncharacterized protein involved in chromosome segregation
MTEHDQHEPIADCDCHSCAIAERDKLRAKLEDYNRYLDAESAEKEMDRLRVKLEAVSKERDELAAQVGVKDYALSLCRFDSLNMTLADLDVCRKALSLTPSDALPRDAQDMWTACVNTRLNDLAASIRKGK